MPDWQLLAGWELSSWEPVAMTAVAGGPGALGAGADGAGADAGVGAGAAAGTGGAFGAGAAGAGAGTGVDGPHPAEICVGDYLLADFETGFASASWRPYNDGTPGGTMTPAPGSAVAVEASVDGGSNALHMQGSGFSSWGAGIGRTFEAPLECKERSVGIRFRAKGKWHHHFRTARSPQ